MQERVGLYLKSVGGVGECIQPIAWSFSILRPTLHEAMLLELRGRGPLLRIAGKALREQGVELRV